MSALIAFAVLAVALVIAGHVRDQRHADQLRSVLSRHDGERHAWARERQELLTRIQAPHLVPVPLPVAPPGEAGAATSGDDPFEDEFHLVGTIAGEPADDEVVL